jgi:hypothetical protein
MTHAELEKLAELEEMAIAYCKRVASLTWTLEMKHGFMGGFLACRELAAGVADEYVLPDGDHATELAQSIRALGSEGEEKKD